ncbi:hypothetical protein NB231_01863 [Nitrococcus mobilis Nb-231]|uniref:Uncharacterized protein n=1 Tax=Nitrococcus mobilis Nb-231 TaxID=314278 RepID=A4BUA9_9GAMM|nr:hypothetical protein NB231_01863 [Nitrococcus mobilis Nb-231]
MKDGQHKNEIVLDPGQHAMRKPIQWPLPNIELQHLHDQRLLCRRANCFLYGNLKLTR